MLVATIPPLQFTEHAQAEDTGQTFIRQDSFTWFDEDWTYAKKISIADNVEAYQTKIIMSKSDDASADVDCEGHCNDNFSDIRFACANGTLVPHWIEEKTDGDECTVWINNSYNASTLYMYYNNSGASPQSNGADTFIYFEDFSSDPGWGTGEWYTITTDLPGVKDFAFEFDYYVYLVEAGSYAGEFRFHLNSDTATDAGMRDEYETDRPYYRISCFDGSSASNDWTPADDTWYEIKIERLLDNNTCKIFHNESLISTETTDDDGGITQLQIGRYDGGGGYSDRGTGWDSTLEVWNNRWQRRDTNKDYGNYVDNVFLRYFEETEPTYTFGAEQEQGISITLNSPTDGALLERTASALLNVTVEEPNTDAMTVVFYNYSDNSSIHTESNVASGSTAIYNWSGLDAGAEYKWYVNVSSTSYQTESDIFSFTPNDEPQIYNMHIEEINPSNATFQWQNEPNTDWISLKVGSDIMEVRKLTLTSNNWTVNNLYPNYDYYFQWQIGDTLNSFSDYYDFEFRTEGWKPDLQEYAYRKLVTIDSEDLATDAEDTAINLTLTEDTFRYSSGSNWWDPTYPAFTHLNSTTHSDIRFVNYYDTKFLDWNASYWDVPGDGGLEEQTLPDETYYTGSFINPDYAHDDDWTTKATPNTHGTLYYNYTIPAGAKTTSKFRAYQGDWVWDITLPSAAYGGDELRFKTECDYNSPYAATYVWNYTASDWELAQDTAYGSSNSTSRYFYETMMTWEYNCEAHIHVMPEHYRDGTRSYGDGIDADYDVKFWMYYGNEDATTNDTTAFATVNDATCTIGTEDSFIPDPPVIEDVTEYNATTNSINLSFNTTEIGDSYITIAENPWMINSTVANRTIEVTESFTHISANTTSEEQLQVYSPYFNQTISVECSNSAYNSNYTVNRSTGDNPVTITFEDMDDDSFYDWNITYSMYKVYERNKINHDFMINTLANTDKYYYQITAENDGGTETHTGNFTLGTLPSTPDANITSYTEDRPNATVTVTAEVTDFDGAADIDCQLQYWKDGDETFSWTPVTTLDGTGTFSEDITVEYNNTYYYRVKAAGDTTGYSDAYSNLFMGIAEFFAGNYIEDDDNNGENTNQRYRQYLPPKADGTVNLSAYGYEQTGYWEGSLQEEDWMWIETNISVNLPLTVKLYTMNDGHVGDYEMTNDTDSVMQYVKLDGLEQQWYTFHIENNLGETVLNWTKPGPIHLKGESRTDEPKYVSFNGTPENIDYDLLYMDYKWYNTSAYQWAIDALGGDIYTAMQVEYFGGGREAGLGPEVSGTAYDRGRLFRGGIINGEMDDTGMLSDQRATFTDDAERHCYAFTCYWWNTSVVPTNNIENYYYRYWTSNWWWSEYFGYPQTRTFDYNSLFSWGPDQLSHTRDWGEVNGTRVGTETLVKNVTTDIFNSDYNQSLMVGYKDGFSMDVTNDKIYNMGFYTDGRWTNQQLGPHQQGYVVFNLPDNTTLQAMDSDSDTISDYDELFVHYTNPKCNDTDEDDTSDGYEVSHNLDPLLHTQSNDPPTFVSMDPTDHAFTSEQFMWTFSDDNQSTLTYDIYLDEGEISDPTTLIAEDLINTSYNMTLDDETTYSWKIVASDGQYTVSSDVQLIQANSVYLAEPEIESGQIISRDTGSWDIFVADEHGLFNWSIETVPDVGSATGTDAANGTISCTLSGLEYSTTYTVYVNVTGSQRNETYTFTTQDQPANEDYIDVVLSPQAEANIEVNRSAWEPNIGITGDIKTDTVWGLLDNNGSIAVDVTVNVSNTVNWTAAPTAAHNQFQMQIHNGSWYTIGNTHQTFRENLAYNEDQTFGLQLFMPTSSETNTNQTATITFVATAD